jgi:hypothetical protein
MTTLGRAALLGLVGFVLAVAALHWLEPGLDARTEAVSYYVHGRHGWVLTAALVALGAASGAIALGLARAALGSTLGLGLLTVWTVGVLLGAAVPADPRGRWNEPPSLAGAVHGQAAIAAFVALPIAAHRIARRLRAQAGWREAGMLTALAPCTAAGLLLFVAALAPVFVRPGPPILLGLAERVLLASYAAWLGAAAVGMIRNGPRLAGG